MFEREYRERFGLDANADISEHLKQTHYSARTTAQQLMVSVALEGILREALTELRRNNVSSLSVFESRVKSVLPNFKE